MSKEIKMKILIVRVGRIGDMVMITAAVNAILEYYSQAEIHMLTGKDGKRVFQNFSSRLSQFYNYNRKSFNAVSLRYKLKKVISQEQYTHIYCFETNPSYLKLFSKSKAEIHVNENCTKDKNFSWHCLQTVSRAIKKPVTHWVSLKVSDTALTQTNKIFSKNNIDRTNFIIGMHPSFSALKKNKLRSQRDTHERDWPEDNWAELAGKLKQYGLDNDIKIQVIMDLLEEDKTLGERIKLKSNNAVKVLIPEMNFERYKATLQSMDLLITPNTGPMHIAGALGTNMVALFSVESPDNCGPYVPFEQYHALLAEGMPEPDLGLSAISVDVVFTACVKFIKLRDKIK